MAKSSIKFPSAASALLLFGLLLAILDTTGAQIGVCYGRNGNNLPSPGQVVGLYNQNNIRRMRVYDPTHDVLDALRGSSIDLIIGVPNSDLQRLAGSQPAADGWVQDNIKNYGNVRFRYIAVGNELKPGMYESQFLVPAMIKIQNSINGAGLGNQIKVSSAIETGALATSYPPSNGTFKQDYLAILNPLINFCNSNGSPLLVNLYTYFSHVGDPTNVPLNYALFTYPGVRFTDGSLQYTNVFDAILDAVYAALGRINGGSLKVVISESGWPTAGGAAASTDNARIYNNNLIQHVKNGSPKRRGSLETYVFAMFDENQKSGGIEQNWGLFSPNQQAKYPTNFN
jgi:hypothetical protein